MEDMTTNIGFAIMGVILIIVFFVVIYLRIKLVKRATEKTKATVTITDSSKHKRAVFTYLVNGAWVSVASSNSSRNPPMKSGIEVDLYYVPENPQKIYVPKENKLYVLMCMVILFMGVLSLWIGVPPLFK